MRNRQFLIVLVLVSFLQMSLAMPAQAFSLGKVLGEVSGALDRVSATINRTFGGVDEDNQKVLEKSREKAPETSAFLGKYEEKWEISMGEKTHESLKKKPGFLRDKRYLDRLGTVARRLIKHVERKNLTWRFAVLDTKEVNAFAAPGGFIYVTKGLMDKIENEHELAGVVAHEMGHVDKKHSVRQAEKAGLMTLIVAGMGLHKKTKKYAPYAAVAAYFTNLKFSRNDEFEADACAVKYSHAAGYDPNGLLSFFDKINNDSKASKVTKYFSTHPPTKDRIKAVQKQIAKLPSRSQTSASAQTPANTGNSSVSSNSGQQSSNSNQNTSSSGFSTAKPTNAQLQRSYETYLYYKQVYQYKVQQQAPMNEVMDAFNKYQKAKENYLKLRKAAVN